MRSPMPRPACASRLSDPDRARAVAQVAGRQAWAQPRHAGRADGPDESEAEVTLPGSYSIAAGLRDTIGGLPGIAQVEEI